MATAVDQRGDGGEEPELVEHDRQRHRGDEEGERRGEIVDRRPDLGGGDGADRPGDERRAAGNDPVRHDAEVDEEGDDADREEEHAEDRHEAAMVARRRPDIPRPGPWQTGAVVT